MAPLSRSAAIAHLEAIEKKRKRDLEQLATENQKIQGVIASMSNKPKVVNDLIAAINEYSANVSKIIEAPVE